MGITAENAVSGMWKNTNLELKCGPEGGQDAPVWVKGKVKSWLPDLWRKVTKISGGCPSFEGGNSVLLINTTGDEAGIGQVRP